MQTSRTITERERAYYRFNLIISFLIRYESSAILGKMENAKII